MTPIISIIGPSKADRTLLSERLIAEITKRGYRVASAKRDAHAYDLDTPGKASWRHSQAGAETVVVSSSARLTVFKKVEREWSLDELAQGLLADADIIIADGYTAEKTPKIKVLISETEENEQVPEGELIAVVASEPGADQAGEVPRFGRNEIGKLTDLVEEKFLKKRSGII